jgi:DHA1 family bicyclomycin/chloramphenicol resistance-like MFS transporter
LWLTFMALGLILPATSVMAMDAQPRLSGTASSMMGSMQFLLGALVVGLLGLLASKGVLTMLWGMAVSALLAWGLARWVLKAATPAPVRQ